MDGAEKMQLDARYDADFLDCPRCDGSGHRVECIDDMCHGKGHCMHGDNTCILCGGTRAISRELRDRWWGRESGEAVDIPEPDQRLRGIA